MFKRATAGLIVLSLLVCGIWIYFWHKPPGTGKGYFVSYPVRQPLHAVCDLSGLWTSYASVSEAWQRESRKPGDAQGLLPSLSFVLEPRQILLPSDEGFAVAAKSFQIQSEWSAKRVALTIGGIRGRAEVYLNGADAAHQIGVVEGAGTYSLSIESARFLYGQENILIIHMTQSAAMDKQIWGGRHEQLGVTGALLLEALPEGSLSRHGMSAEYRAETQEIVLAVEVSCAQEQAGVGDVPGECWLEGELIRGRTVEAKGNVPVRREGGGMCVSLPLTLQGQQIEMWSPEKPVLYDLTLFLKNSQGVVDSLQMPLGFARPGLARDGGWVLNGEAMAVRGVALTQEQAAVLQSANAIESYLGIQKEQGFNVVYLIDYINEYWLDAADLTGIGLWCELPVAMTASDKLPGDQDLEAMLSLGRRHPSLLAWTVLKGGETGNGTSEYLDAAARLAVPRLTYDIAYRASAAASGGRQDFRTLVVTANSLTGPWGEITAAADEDIRAAAANSEEAVNPGQPQSLDLESRTTDHEPRPWTWEKVAAPLCFVFLLFVEAANLRVRELSYTYLMTEKHLKRWTDAVGWMRFMTFMGGMAVAAALCLHAFLLIPGRGNPWLAYPWGFVERAQSMPLVLLWLTLGLVFVGMRLLQLGLASPGFRHSPDALKMVCWIEQRCNWRWIAALG
ncbi:MAG: hypothetical protein LBB49_03300, partial [Gracilibacteraceae bacterium]|nr:hypothetical protein [Gracilibacteraceae bacterium]